MAAMTRLDKYQILVSLFKITATEPDNFVFPIHSFNTLVDGYFQ